MRAIITKQNAQGDYDSVGMTNRALVSHLKTEHGVLKWAAVTPAVSRTGSSSLLTYTANRIKP